MTFRWLKLMTLMPKGRLISTEGLKAWMNGAVKEKSVLVIFIIFSLILPPLLLFWGRKDAGHFFLSLSLSPGFAVLMHLALSFYKYFPSNKIVTRRIFSHNYLNLLNIMCLLCARHGVSCQGYIVQYNTRGSLPSWYIESLTFEL